MCACISDIFADDEKELVDIITKWCYGEWPFRACKLRKLAYEYAKSNNISGFSPTSNSAGRKWLKAFLRRHPQLKVKTTRNLSLHRAMCTSEKATTLWFPQYQRWLQLNNVVQGDYLWNVDESGVGDIPCEGDTVIGVDVFRWLVGKRQRTTLS